MSSEYVTLSISIPRRWLQFNLRTALVLMLIAAVGAAVKYGLDRAANRPLAFDGYSPVSLVDESRWVRGDKAFAEPYQGRLYYFVNATQRETFLKAPDKFSLAASGLDVVLVKNAGRKENGFRQFGYKYREKMYLFSSAASMNEFGSAPATYADFADEWTKGKY
jgi:YHS domain-containing protein